MYLKIEYHPAMDLVWAVTLLFINSLNDTDSVIFVYLIFFSELTVQVLEVWLGIMMSQYKSKYEDLFIQ